MSFRRNTSLTAVVLAAVAVLGTAIPSSGITTAEIEARIAALSRQTMKSADGNFIVVGTNRVESFALSKWCDNAVKRVGTITGIKPPFNKRQISIVVNENGHSDPKRAYVRYFSGGGQFVARVFLGSYDAAYDVRGRQAITCAILALYVKDSGRGMLDMPRWLWAGIEQNLLFDVRSRNLEKVLSLWRSAKLPPLIPLLADDSEKAVRDPERLAIYSTFIHFITTRPERREIFRCIFAQDGKKLTPQKLKDLICGPAVSYDLEEAWERWLLQQSQVVHTSTILSTRSIDQLRAELMLYPGASGIPLDVEIPHGSTFRILLKYRNAEWLPGFVSKKCGRLNMIAAGHTGDLVKVIKQFNEFLSGLETRASDRVLSQRLEGGYRSLKALAEKVEEAGGMIYEEPPQPQPRKVKTKRK